MTSFVYDTLRWEEAIVNHTRASFLITKINHQNKWNLLEISKYGQKTLKPKTVSGHLLRSPKNSTASRFSIAVFLSPLTCIIVSLTIPTQNVNTKNIFIAVSYFWKAFTDSIIRCIEFPVHHDFPINLSYTTTHWIQKCVLITTEWSLRK